MARGSSWNSPTSTRTPCKTPQTCPSTRACGTPGYVRTAWPSLLAQNCSGKHAAMLYTCQLNGWTVHAFLDPAHPLQQAIAATTAELTGQRVAQTTVDGCGAPLFSVSLHGLALVPTPPRCANATVEVRVYRPCRPLARCASGAGSLMDTSPSGVTRIVSSQACIHVGPEWNT